MEIPFSVPPYAALLGRSVASLEGIALLGDPDYQVRALTCLALLTCAITVHRGGIRTSAACSNTACNMLHDCGEYAREFDLYR